MKPYTQNDFFNILQSASGDKFLDTLKDVNDKKVTETIAYMKIYTTIFLARENKLSEMVIEQNKLLSIYINTEYQEGKMNIPDWLLLRHIT